MSSVGATISRMTHALADAQCTPQELSISSPQDDEMSTHVEALASLVRSLSGECTVLFRGQPSPGLLSAVAKVQDEARIG